MDSVKYLCVTIPVYPIKRGDGEYWQFRRASGQQVTRATKEKARAAALIEAQTIFKGGMDIGDLTPDQIRGIKRMLEVDPELSMVDEFLLWHSRRAPRKNCGDAVTEFLAAKLANQGRSTENLRTLKFHLKALAPLNSRCLSTITVTDFPAISGTARTRRNRIKAWITFFTWCRKQGYLPQGEKVAPERLDIPTIAPSTPTTYSPAQLRTMLANVAPIYLPWLACAAYAGIRAAEICPPPGSGKSPLDWSDFGWERGTIIVRAETDKNGRRRIIPILPALERLLKPIALESGPCIPMGTRRPSSGQGKRPELASGQARDREEDSETTRLGKLMGGWKRNALRHSWISYRAAVVGIAQASQEAGNSESEARKSYHDAMSAEDAAEWFSVQ